MQGTDAIKRINEHIKLLTEALEAGQSDNLKDFLAMSSNFHRYSLNNWFLIYSQCPEATRVAGYKTWQKLGRNVIKGGNSIRILAPRKYKKKDKQGDKTGEEGIWFTTVAVFDISQTEGEDLPSVFNSNGDPGEYMEALEGLICEKGIYLVDVDYLEGALGTSSIGIIKVMRNLEPAQRFTALVHELAHELMHTREDRESLSGSQKETEAEAVAFVVGQAIGVDSLGQAADYVQLWKGDIELFKTCLVRIQKCAKTIIEGLASRVTVAA